MEKQPVIEKIIFEKDNQDFKTGQVFVISDDRDTIKAMLRMHNLVSI